MSLSFPSYLPLPKDSLYGEYIRSSNTYADSEFFLKKNFSQDLFSSAQQIQKITYPRNDIFDSVCRLAEKAGCLTDKRRILFEKIKDSATFLVVTGHQPLSALGPAFFISKINALLAATQWLKCQFPSLFLLPVFWLASEDHDVEEASVFPFFGEKIQVEFSDYKGQSVGSLHPRPLSEIIKTLTQNKNIQNENQSVLKEFIEAYQYCDNLTVATARILYRLWNEEDLMILDGSDPVFKKNAVSLFRREIENQFLKNTFEKFRKEFPEFKLFIEPRNYNLFLFENSVRKRIIASDEKCNGNCYTVKDPSELVSKLESHPELFSPNVLMRTLYQQLVLPCVMYLGGPAEVNYWIQMIPAFVAAEIPFPLVRLRPQMIYAGVKHKKFLDEEQISLNEIFSSSPDEMINKKVIRVQIPEIFDEFRQSIEQNMISVKKNFDEVDKGMTDFLSAQEKRLLDIIHQMENKYKQSLRRKEEEQVRRWRKLYAEFLPENRPNERSMGSLEILMRWKASEILTMHQQMKDYIFQKEDMITYVTVFLE